MGYTGSMAEEIGRRLDVLERLVERMKRNYEKGERGRVSREGAKARKGKGQRTGGGR